jgi:hypothetical protein
MRFPVVMSQLHSDLIEEARSQSGIGSSMHN